MSLSAERKQFYSHGAAAMAIASAILFVPANILPFMTLETFGQQSSPTIWGGVVSLYETGSPFLAAIVFAASIVLPIVKIVVILTLLTPFGQKMSRQSFETTVFVFDLIGRWAMLDVFLLAILVAVMKFGSLGRAAPGLGAVLFAVVVVATMAAYSFMEKLVKHRSEPLHEQAA